jgi:hypothetical protein
VSPPIDNHTVEYWLDFTLDPLPNDDDGRVYAEVLRQLWLSELSSLSLRIALECTNRGQNFSCKMRYQGNTSNIWLTPIASILAWLDQPLAETPCPKDKWVSEEGFVSTHPPIADEHSAKSALLLFGRQIQDGYDDPEGQGGKIALIVDNTNNLVQHPPNSLDRLDSSLPKQVAYTQRILRAGPEIDGINCESILKFQ